MKKDVYMLNLNSIMLGTKDPKALASFYEMVLGKKPDMAEADWYGFSVGSCFLSIGMHDKVSGRATNPERINRGRNRLTAFRVGHGRPTTTRDRARLTRMDHSLARVGTMCP